MLSMDLKSTGITWVGNMYQKLEAVCQEVCDDVESIMFQDTKYVESQVQTVGINVRKFCNEVMQDLLSSSACSVKGPVSDLSLIYDMDVNMSEKSKKGSEECHASEKLSPTTELKTIVSDGEVLNAISLSDAPQDVTHGESCDPVIGKSIPISIEVPEYTSSEIVGENHNSVSDIAASVASPPSTFFSESVVPVVSHGSELLESELVLSNSAFSNDAIGICISDKKTTPVSHTEIEREEDEEPAVLLDLPVTSESAGTRGLDNSGWLEACEADTETIEEFQDIKLEESCIHVEKNGHCSISRGAGKNGSYKKKIRDAFASKLQTAKKHDDEQFAVWYDDMDMGTKLRAGISSIFTLVDNLEPKQLSSQDCSESDWELL